MPEMVLSPVFYSISEVDFGMPYRIVQTSINWFSLLLGVLNFYPQKHYSVEPHSLGFHGSAYRLDTRFLKRLITFSSVLNNTTNAMTNQYRAFCERRGFKPNFPVKFCALGYWQY